MTATALEEKIRASLAFSRFFSAYMPNSMANRLIRVGVARVRLPAGIERTPVSADGVPGEWLIPHNSPPDKALLYLHGGGFTLAASPLHYDMLVSLAQRMGVRALMPDYRLAPSHPFPAALDDCVTAYRWLLKQGHDARNIVIAGDSAGGNLTLTTLMKLRDSGDPLPAAAACLSPVAELSDKGELHKSIDDPLLHPRAGKFFTRSYVGPNDARTPLISPVFGNWRGLPPLLVHAGEDEILRHDAFEVEKRAKAAGVDVRLECYPRMWHVWQLFPKLPQTAQSLDDIAQFLGRHLGMRAA